VDVVSSWDLSLFRWINRDWSHPALDPVMRFLSGNPLFGPGLAILAVVLIWRDRPRGLVYVVALAVAAGLANALISDPLKHWVERPRPYAALTDVVLRVGRGNPLGSMPSAHAMNCALIATLTGWYYRRTLAWVPPLAFGVALSRVYNGAHFPTDVLAGIVLGAGFGAVYLRGLDFLWTRFVHPRFPGLARRVPSILRPCPSRVLAGNGTASGSAAGVVERVPEPVGRGGAAHAGGRSSGAGEPGDGEKSR
jgi:undecaprenyl-diphosphatase